MKAIIRKAITLVLPGSGFLTLHAQTFSSKYEIGISAGVFVYQGDLTPEKLGSYRTMKPGLDVYINKIISPVFSLRTSLAIGALKGDDGKYSAPPYRQQRNFNFNSPVFEVSELAVADLSRNNMSRRSSGLSPYVLGGIGFSFLNIKRDYSRFNSEYFAGEPTTIAGLSADAQHSLPRILLVIPLGIGIRYPLSQRIMISAETSYRFTFTDYLDGFSKAANDAKKDSYLSHTIGIVYRFITNNSMKCPVF